MHAKSRTVVESFDVEATTLQTSDVQRLSHLHLEDIFTLTSGNPMKMYVAVDAAQNHFDFEWWGDVFAIAIETILLSTVNILNANAGQITPGQLIEHFNRNEGFSIAIGGFPDIRLTFSWKTVIQYSSVIMFFRPLSQTCICSDLFVDGHTSLNKIRATFHWFSHQTCGNYMSSHALLSAHLNECISHGVWQVTSHASFGWSSPALIAEVPTNSLKFILPIGSIHLLVK